MDDRPGSETDNLEYPMGLPFPGSEPDPEQGVVVSCPGVRRRAPWFFAGARGETGKGELTGIRHFRCAVEIHTSFVQKASPHGLDFANPCKQ